MQRTKIEWVKNPDGNQGYSWNPIKGLCPVGCWYCYARRFYKRFILATAVILDTKEIVKPIKRKKPSTIFVCSTFELFHPSVNKWDRERIFDVINDCQQHTFIILTKLPQNVDRDMPDNVWFGVSITNFGELKKAIDIHKIKAKIKFISYEPLLTSLHTIMPPYNMRAIDWVIIGRLTGYGRKHDPKRDWIEEIVNEAKKYDLPVFLKDNLKDIWPGELIQEFPRVK